MTLKTLIENDYQKLFFRLTLDNSLQEIYDVINQYPFIHKFIVSEEISKLGKKHYHILTYTYDKNQKNVKQNMKNFLDKYYPLEDNSDHAFSEFRQGTEKRLSSYVVKDGKFLYKGFSEEEIRMFTKMSYKKYDPKMFMLDRDELIEKFLRDESQDDQENLCNDYAALKTKYRQRHTMSTMESDIRLINDIKYPGTTGANLHRKIFLN